MLIATVITRSHPDFLKLVVISKCPIALKEKIRKENNIEVLSKLLRYAAKCKSIDEFIQKAL